MVYPGVHLRWFDGSVGSGWTRGTAVSSRTTGAGSTTETASARGSPGASDGLVGAQNDEQLDHVDWFTIVAYWHQPWWGPAPQSRSWTSERSSRNAAARSKPPARRAATGRSVVPRVSRCMVRLNPVRLLWYVRIYQVYQSLRVGSTYEMTNDWSIHNLSGRYPELAWLSHWYVKKIIVNAPDSEL